MGIASVGKVEGANFKIVFKAGGSSSVYKGVVEGAQITGEATFGGMTTMAFTGSKNKSLTRSEPSPIL